jgi:tetratricopeptide (TPR) repeat protein
MQVRVPSSSSFPVAHEQARGRHGALWMFALCFVACNSARPTGPVGKVDPTPPLTTAERSPARATTASNPGTPPTAAKTSAAPPTAADGPKTAKAAPDGSVSPTAANNPNPPPTAANTPAALLPRDEGPFYPSLIRTRTEPPVDPTALADVASCGRCHRESVHEWSASAHAHASFDNPWYRASVDALRHDVNYGASRHCAGCHDPVLLFAGKMEADVSPQEPLAVAGVTCLVCHSARAATSDGNASFSLDTSAVPIPEPNDPASLQRHRERLAGADLKSPLLCASCHRGFLGRHTGIGHHLSGMDEPGAWRASVFGGTRSYTLEHAQERNCRDCHMQAEPALLPDPSAKAGALHSHRFPGAQTALAALSGDPRQLDATIAELRSSAALDIAVARKNDLPFVTADPIELAAGDRIALDVTIANRGVGHQFPGGLKDLQDTWLELEIRDGRGRVLAHAGDQQARTEDPSAFVLRALVVNADGRPETRHLVTHFGSVAYDHTVASLAARVVRYTLTLPRGFAAPLRAAAKLRHRKHRSDARELACEATRNARGRAFVARARALGMPVLDGCRAEPIVEIASSEVELGPSHAENQKSAFGPRWFRLYQHALGLSLTLQERLDEASWSAESALRELESQPSAADDRANVLVLLARIAGRQGRLEVALAFADRAFELVGEQPAIERARADAYAQVWHWPEAADALSKVTELARFDTASFRELARARLSANDPVRALPAAQGGLRLQPRDEGLLRSQALALEALGSPDAKAARDAFVFYREADEANASRLACDRHTPLCARDSLPVVTIALTPERAGSRAASVAPLPQ